MNPFKEICHIKSSEEILDKAFKRASKISEWESIRDPLLRKKTRDIEKVMTIRNVICSELEKIIKSFPNIDSLNSFYKELLQTVCSEEELRRALSSLNWARLKIDELAGQYKRKIKGARDFKEVERHRRAFYGRVASIMKKLKDKLDFLISVRKELIRFPSLKEDMFTCVIAGFPNVGKSSLTKRLTGSEVKIKDYPFTTKGILVGYIDDVVQIIDTPGMLDRDPEKMNKIEKKAFSALKNLADLVIFVFDPTESCGYSIKEQKNLLEKVKKFMADKKIILVLNKSDVLSNDLDLDLKREDFEKIFKVSCKTGEGIEDLRNYLITKAKKG